MPIAFRTELHPSNPRNITLGYANTIVCIGSCFATHMAMRLQDAKFKAFSNPFGIVFNPVSLGQQLRTNLPINRMPFIETALGWNSFEYHSIIHAETAEALETQCIAKQHQLNTALQTATLVIITLGTAYVYRHIELDIIVANCHKVPGKAFTKELLTIEQCVSNLQAAIDHLQSINPNIQILLTVSPVRHIKDTLEGNQRSKSVLLLTCHYLLERYPFCQYFPAYELLLDDLRDYRYYDEDLLHPNQQAITYIWDAFIRTYMTPETQATMQEWLQIQKAIQHNPFGDTTASYKKFLNNTLEKLLSMSKKLDLTSEIANLNDRISNHAK